MTRKQYFSSGLKDGMPICFGYFAVSFAFGIQAAGIGLSVFEASVLSALNVTSAGQFAALAIIASGASLIELAFTQLIINLRYFLMSCALSQKLSPSLPLGHRLGIAYGMTDEIFAVSVSQREPLSPFYNYGLIAVAIPGWVLGTALGAAAGNILSAVLTNALGIAIYTIGSDVFAGAEAAGANAVEEVAWVAPAHPLKLVASKPVEKSGVDLFKAEAVVAAGRGFAEKEDLDLARALCDKIGAGLGCSRPLTEGVDWLPSEVYIGVSGLMLAPKVYVACGISGQMQHMVGCNRSGAIFAINKDKNAPIFKQCDFGLIGDIKDVLPAITAAL